MLQEDADGLLAQGSVAAAHVAAGCEGKHVATGAAGLYVCVAGLVLAMCVYVALHVWQANCVAHNPSMYLCVRTCTLVAAAQQDTAPCMGM